MRDLKSDIEVRRLLGFAARNNSATSSSVDCLGFESLTIAFDFGAYVDSEFSFEVDESNDQVGWEKIENPYLNTTSRVGQLPLFSAASGVANTIVTVRVNAFCRYVRVRAVPNSSGPTGSPFGVSAILGHRRKI